ncbi:MAG TPA: hypothetical protein PKD86_15855 [Gemmatales bacterium]|nr:hypothetical protein [Gemmatales bacterium]HMP60819.1 hypothetical protein [Gemmatales bacterium]
MTPRQTELLVQALKSTLGQTEALPLFRHGKTGGLFAKGADEEAAAQHALAHGLLVAVRSEARGKTAVDWVEITPRGVQFLQQHESPKEVLAELLAALDAQSAGMPRWAADLKAQLQALSHRLATYLEQQEQAFERLRRRAEEALRRVAPPPAHSQPLAAWQLDVLDHLDRCQATGVQRECGLAQLFGELRQAHPHLNVTELHEGLLQLRDRAAVRLVPFAGPISDLAEPEFALLDGNQIYHAAERA